MTENTPAYRVEPDAPAREMPRYVSQKTVHALRIRHLQQCPADHDSAIARAGRGSWMLHFQDAAYGPLEVGHNWVTRHNPQSGWYYIVYADGYASASPSQAFEAGNTLVTDYGIPRPQEPKYTIGERGRITNRRTGKQVPPGEPLFFIRAQDKLAMQTLVAYRNLVVTAGLNPDSINERVLAFSAFAEQHPELMKLPNVSPPPRSEATPNPQAAWPFPTAAGG